MHVAGLDLPVELVDAHRDGHLVLFVGAGASLAPPSCLQDFVGLVKRIAEQTGQECPECVEDAPDRALGLLDAKEGVDVHSLIRDEILQSTAPSEVHQQISRFAVSTNAPRIVTTNYDMHLSTCLAQHWQSENEFREFAAPALPQGDDFTGIVYLHGAVTGSPEHLVATGTDFADAYIRRRWASDFLLRMFDKYTVLFVGYSVDDVLMRYLTLGPLAGSRRFALVSNEKQELTARSGIHQIAYDDHERLPGLLAEWNGEVRLSLHDHRIRVRGMLQGEPPRDTASDAYLRESFASPERRRFFTEYARNAEWLRWAAEQAGLFSLCESSEHIAQANAWDLSWWFAGNFATNCDCDYGVGTNRMSYSELAFQVVAESEIGLGPNLRRALVLAIRDADDTSRPELLRRWVPVMLEGAMPYEAEDLGMLLEVCSLPADRLVILQLIEYLTTPRLVMRNRSLLYAPTGLDLRIDVGLHEVHWEDVIRPMLPQLAADLAPVLDHQLRTASRLAGFDPRLSDKVDLFSVTRTAVRPSAYDHTLAGEASGLIDLARDVLEALVAVEPSEATVGLLIGWQHADEKTLRRLAVHGWTKRVDMGGDEKLEWLIASGLLSDKALAAETWHLLDVTVAEASNEAVAKLVKHIQEGAGQ